MLKLPPADVAWFIPLYRTLHLYVNDRVQTLPEVRTLEDLEELTLEDQVKLRDALYDRPDLIESFVADNPSGLAAEELAEVSSWSRFIRGDFYVMRHLKRYSVFLSSGEPARAYGVLGLTESIADRFPDYSLPVYLKTVLLPFKGQIIWDGFANYFNITFGPGMRASFNETYQRVKQREGIVESLTDPDRATATKATSHRRKVQPDLRPIIQGIVAASEQLRPGATPLQSRAYGVLRAAAHLAETATNAPPDLPAIDEQMRAVNRAYRQLATAYEREVDRD